MTLEYIESNDTLNNGRLKLNKWKQYLEKLSVNNLLSAGLYIDGANRFNKDKVTSGKYVVFSTGSLADNTNYNASEFIGVTPSTKYMFTPLDQYAWYDNNKAYISGGSSSTTINPITSPSNAYYIRLTVHNTALATAMFYEGTSTIPYEPYKYPLKLTTLEDLNNFQTQVDKNLSGINSEQLLLQTAFEYSINLFDKSRAKNGYYISLTTGVETANANYLASDYIPVNPNNKYWYSVLDQFAWYDSSKKYISGGSKANTTNPLTPPVNANYIKITAHNLTVNELMFVESDVAPSHYVPYEMRFNQSLLDSIPQPNERLYNISQIFNEWQSGNKFPVAFVDDSQTDGVGTTGYVANQLGIDQHSPNAYPKILEDRMKILSGNSNLRIYNSGFSGKTAQWMNTNFESQFGSGKPFADTKIAFVGFGTNDRLSMQTPKAYYDSFKTELKNLIDNFISKGIQVVLMTEQPAIAPSVSSLYATNHPLRNAGYINAVANKVKFDLASEYNLEVVDLTETLRKVMHGRTSMTINSIYNNTDGLHFGDNGHKLVYEVFMSVIYPYTQKVTDNEVIDLSSQKIFKGVPEDKVSFGAYGLFRTYSDYAVTADELLLKQSIYIDDYSKYALRFYSRVNSSAYIKVNGVNINAQSSTLESKIDAKILEPGYYDIEVWSGATQAGFNGISLVRQNFEM